MKLLNNLINCQANLRIFKKYCKLFCTHSDRLYANENHQQVSTSTQFICFKGNWPENEQQEFIRDMKVIPSFITAEEESKLLEEIEPYLKRLRYEFDHWDDAIHGFRETERKNWYPHNRAVLDRVKNVAFNGEIMPFVHVLDLAKDGVIKPHVDSTRYCGTTIAGLSLLSDCVMRLIRTDEKKYQQTDSSDNYRDQPTDDKEFMEKYNFYADILLTRRSLYIMSNSARYKFTHEILANTCSEFNGTKVEKDRRISIICRNEP